MNSTQFYFHELLFQTADNTVVFVIYTLTLMLTVIAFSYSLHSFYFPWTAAFFQRSFCYYIFCRWDSFCHNWTYFWTFNRTGREISQSMSEIQDTHDTLRIGRRWVTIQMVKCPILHRNIVCHGNSESNHEQLTSWICWVIVS